MSLPCSSSLSLQWQVKVVAGEFELGPTTCATRRRQNNGPQRYPCLHPRDLGMCSPAQLQDFAGVIKDIKMGKLSRVICVGPQ